MITILNDIMASNALSAVDVGLNYDMFNIYLFKAKNSHREEYFLTLELTDTSDKALRDFLDEKAQEIFEDIQKSGKVEVFFEKNCTMLICLKSEKLKPELILAFEEDPYNFKKNVITYSDDELAELNNYLKKKSITKFGGAIVNEILNANEGRDFLDFKYQKKRSAIYDLTIRIALKLPFLIYTPREQKLENLSKQIDDAIPIDKHEIFNQMLTAEWTDENVLDRVESIWGMKT